MLLIVSWKGNLGKSEAAQQVQGPVSSWQATLLPSPARRALQGKGQHESETPVARAELQNNPGEVSAAPAGCSVGLPPGLQRACEEGVLEKVGGRGGGLTTYCRCHSDPAGGGEFLPSVVGCQGVAWGKHDG